MISDEKRREVAQELRELRHTTYYREEVVENIRDVISIADPVNTFREPEDVYKLLADLIDRPTCHDVGGGYEFRCSACGCVIHIFRDGGFGEDDSAMTVGGDSLYVPHYCPNCGAEVVEEGGCDVPEL